MLQRVPALLLFGLTLAACSPADDQDADAAPAELPAPSADEAALQGLGEDYVEHYNMHHASEVAKLYSDSAWVLAANMSVHEGRAEVEAALAEEMKGSPTLTLTPKESMVFGDHAVGIGEYSVKTSSAGQGEGLTGSYMTLFNRENGQWKIGGLITNLSTTPPADFMISTGDEEEPADDGTMKEFVNRFAEAYNRSDWAAVANMYTSDAQVAYSTRPFIAGTDAIRQRFEESFGTDSKPNIVIHDVGTLPLDQEWALDGGWFTVKASPEGKPFTQNGMYMNLVRRQADGSWKTHWSVVNGYPVPDSVKPGA